MSSKPGLTRSHAQALARQRIRNKDIDTPDEATDETTEAQSLTLHEFVVEAWSILEPATVFKDNWHIHEACRHLEAITYGVIRKLVMMIPPGYMKSLLVNVFWPAWEWAEISPSTRWMFSSYNDRFVSRDSRKMRDLIASSWYQHRYGHRFQITKKKDDALEYHNDKTGFRVSFGTGGGTGYRAHRIVADDPHKISEANSEKHRSKVLTWWRETMSQRMTDPETGTHVVIMQALHVTDLAHDCINNLGYEFIRIPNEFDPEMTSNTSIGFKDPRTEPGEWAWPERFNKAHKIDAILNLTVRGYASQFGQRPYPAGGNMFKREWCKIVKHRYLQYDSYRGWDFAGTEEKPGVEPAYTAGGLILRCRATGRFMVADMRRFRATAGVVKQTVANVASHDGVMCPIVIEQEPGSAGKYVINDYVTTVLVGYTVTGERPTGDKGTRFSPFASQAEIGNVDFLEGEWNDACFTELEQAPNGAFMDQADALAHAFNKLAEHQESTAEIMARLMDEEDSARILKPK